MGDKFGDARCFHLGKVELHVGGVFLEIVKQGFVRGAKYIVDLVNLVDLVISREEWKETDDFEEHTADTPEVHFVSVVSVCEQTLGCSVPTGRDVLGIRLF